VGGRMSVIPHGVSPPPGGRTPQHDVGPIVFAGRFAASKGVALFADTAARLLATRRVEIVLAGGHGDAGGTAAAQRLVDRFPATCRIAGWLDGPRLDALFARATAVLVPSSYEPFGLVAVEAMRMGAPVLAADVGGLRDIVTVDSGGRRIDSRDASAWVDEVRDLLDDPRSAARLSQRGPIDVARRFSSAAAARRLISEVYQRPVAELRRRGGAFRCHEPRCS
jgi:glycosyltransferase involved in cell wall biosynthesis